LGEAVVAYRTRKQVAQVLQNTEHVFANLDLLSGVLGRLERERFGAARLQALLRQLLSHHLPGSLAIARLRTIVQLSDSRRNFIVRVLDLPLMYSLLVAWAAERWRKSHGAAVREWLQATGEVEALISLSTYSFEHPGDPFPELMSGPPCFAGEELGHPLLPAAVCVRNDVQLAGATRVLLVSGSNMSGKSTLLRTVGVNTVLAMAGAPVRARRMRLTPLRVGASIRVTDSLQEGSSRFYAEITRLRELFRLAAGDLPVLFLLDELLQGTNSHDRRIGAEGILRALLRCGSLGMITTHDLALTGIHGPEGNEFHNMHFQDEMQDGVIRFDYRLRDGVVGKSNGLELMRSIGLEV
jgi:DNA mismatch repair ATPase MutS